ncbi:response regulator [Paenibacillus psychroresistens]|uniref:hypothetical protein n=1 Tax=Paenibacillus psychroresistens TaxID=1778678 RepID=UPI0012DA09A6|nr:hypothetical protein [Paenibacillus psychroresistens]
MRILIVDDETAVHDQIKRSIAWRELDWQLAGDAYNGEEGLNRNLAPWVLSNVSA